MKTRILILLLLCLFVNKQFYAQGIIEPKHTFNVEVGMPVSMKNKVYKWMMQGIVNTSGYYQYRFPSNLAVGAGVNFSLFNVNIYRVVPSVKGTMNTLGGFVKLSYEKFYSETFGIDAGLKLGYGKTTFKDSLVAIDHGGNRSYSINALSLTPTVSFKLMADNANAFSFTIGYSLQDFNFYPGRLGYSPQGYSGTDFQGSTQFLSVGFGYTHYIGRIAD